MLPTTGMNMPIGHAVGTNMGMMAHQQHMQPGLPFGQQSQMVPMAMNPPSPFTTDAGLTRSIDGIVAQASKLKGEIFRAVVLRNQLNKRNIQSFELAANDFLKTWSDYAQKIQSDLRSMPEITNPSGIRSIEYEYVKQWIYADYDYASVLQFVDGVTRGIESEKMTSPDDLEDFYAHVISMAFKDPAKDIGGLLHDVRLNELGDVAQREVGPMELAVFNSIRNRRDLFNPRDRVELYKAITSTIKFIIDNEIIREEINFQTAKLFTSLVNLVVGFISYSLVIFAARIYIIGRYVTPFINASKSNPQDMVTDEYSLSQISGSFESAIDDVGTLSDAMAQQHERLALAKKNHGVNSPEYRKAQAAVKLAETNYDKAAKDLKKAAKTAGEEMVPEEPVVEEPAGDPPALDTEPVEEQPQEEFQFEKAGVHKTIDKAKFHIDADPPVSKSKTYSHFKNVFEWLDDNNFLTKEGKEELKNNVTLKNIEQVVINSEYVTIYGMAFLDKAYDKVVKDHFGKASIKKAFDNCLEKKEEAITEAGSSGLPHTMGMSNTDGVTRTDVTENPKGNVSNTMMTLDEMVIRDPNNPIPFFTAFCTFLENVGVKYKESAMNAPSGSVILRGKDNLRGNKIHEKLKENYLYNLIEAGSPYISYGGPTHNDAWIREMNENFKQCMNNRLHALRGETTPRNDILHIIRGMEYGKTVNDYCEQAKDLYFVACEVSCGLTSRLEHLNGRVGNELTYDNALSLGARKLLSETCSLITNFYTEFMWAVGQKAKYLERRINEVKGVEVDKFMGITNIPINVQHLGSDIDLHHSMSMSVPGTMPMPVQHIDHFALPIFEELEMYDEYLRSLPEFAGDEYLSEAGGVSRIINQIISFIRARGQQLVYFANSEHYLHVRKWTVENKDRLAGMTFNGTMQVLPFKPNITIQDDISTLVTALGNFSADDVKDDAAIEKFIQGLYPSGVFEMFAPPKTPKEGNSAYRNMILFGSADTPELKTVSGAELGGPQGLVQQWMGTVIAADKSFTDRFKSLGQEIERAIAHVNTTAYNAGQQQTTQQESVLTEMDMGSTTEGQPEGQEQSSDPLPQGTVKPEGGTAQGGNPTVQKLLVRVNNAVRNLWGWVPNHIINAIRTQHGYVKKAYSIGQEGAKTTAQPAQQQSNV